MGPTGAAIEKPIAMPLRIVWISNVVYPFQASSDVSVYIFFCLS